MLQGVLLKGSVLQVVAAIRGRKWAPAFGVRNACFRFGVNIWSAECLLPLWGPPSLLEAAEGGFPRRASKRRLIVRREIPHQAREQVSLTPKSGSKHSALPERTYRFIPCPMASR